MQLVHDKLNQRDKDLLRVLSANQQTLMETIQRQNDQLLQLSQLVLSLQGKKKDETDLMKTIKWIRQLYLGLQGGGFRGKLASLTAPETTSNTTSNRPWINNKVQLLINLDIAYKSANNSLYARCSLGEAELKLNKYFTDKREVIIDAK